MSRSTRLVVVAIALYSVVFAWLSVRSFNVFGYDSGDTAIYNNMMWHTLHGRPFYISAWGGRSFLTFHTEFFWLALIPFYALWPGPPVLLVLQAVALGVAAWPMFLIARRALSDEVAAVWVVGAFLLLPPLVSQNLNQLHNGPFLLVFLLFAIHYFIERRFGRFAVWAALACLNRENIGLVIAMFGLWALWDRRHWKWSLLPSVLGITYFWAGMQLIKYFKGGEAHVVGYFSYLGTNTSQIVHNAISQPQLILHHLLGQQNVQFFISLIQPLGWLLPFGHPAAVIALPDLAGNLISDNSALKVIGWHYNTVTGTALLTSAVLSLPKLCRLLTVTFGAGRYAVTCAASLTLLAAAHWFLWFNPSVLARRPYHASLNRAIATIPAEASALSSVRIQGHFSTRPRYEAINLFAQNPVQAATFEYVLLDANERQFPPFITQEFFDSFRNNPEYELVFAENNVFVFRRPDGGAPIP